MFDFGKHALAIWSAYGVTLLLLGALVVMSWNRSRRVKAALEKLDSKRHG